MDNLIRSLLEHEEEVIAEVIAFMSYNPAIGRVLQKGGVRKFIKITKKLVSELGEVRNRSEFDGLHEKYTRRMIANFETARGERLSYGQAQKAINVFLKVYVDWAGRSNSKVRNQLLRHLHVPLGSILMQMVRQSYPAWYASTIQPHIKAPVDRDALRSVNKTQYNKWQAFFLDTPRSRLSSTCFGR